MTLEAMRGSIVSELQTGLGVAVNVDAHGGRFTLAELRRCAVKGPTVQVACLGVVSAQQAQIGGVEITAAWGAYVICADKPNAPRDAAALVLVTSLLSRIAGSDWGRDDVDGPNRLRADNLFASELDKQGTALWAVTWQQKITLGRIDPATLDDLLRVVATWDLDTAGIGEPEPVDTIELQGGS